MKRNVTTQEPNSQKTTTPKLAQRLRVLTSGLDEHTFRYSLRTRRHIAYRNGKRLISLGDTLNIRSLHTLCSIRRHGSAQRQQKARKLKQHQQHDEPCSPRPPRTKHYTNSLRRAHTNQKAHFKDQSSLSNQSPVFPLTNPPHLVAQNPTQPPRQSHESL